MTERKDDYHVILAHRHTALNLKMNDRTVDYRCHVRVFQPVPIPEIIILTMQPHIEVNSQFIELYVENVLFMCHRQTTHTYTTIINYLIIPLIWACVSVMSVYCSSTAYCRSTYILYVNVIIFCLILFSCKCSNSIGCRYRYYIYNPTNSHTMQLFQFMS